MKRFVFLALALGLFFGRPPRLVFAGACTGGPGGYEYCWTDERGVKQCTIEGEMAQWCHCLMIYRTEECEEGGSYWQYEGAYCEDFGLKQSCYNTKGYCTYKQQCVPLTSNKLVASTGCSNENPSYLKCQVNCGCCPAGSTWQCTTEGKTAYIIPAAEGNSPKMCKGDELYDNTSWWTNGAVKCWQEACGCTPLCGATAPANVIVSAISPTKATVSWTPETNGVSQSIYAGTNKTEVEQNCPNGIGPGKSCVVADTGLTLPKASIQPKFKELISTLPAALQLLPLSSVPQDHGGR